MCIIISNTNKCVKTIGGDAMELNTLSRFFLECIAIALISSGFIFEDKLIQMEQKLFKKLLEVLKNE
jgi:hypothetical protein